MRCCVGLGGNLGDVGETFARAIRAVQCLGHRIHAVSPMYQTTPMGAHAGDRYWNAAFVMEASRTPHELLDELQQIESTLGRQRGMRWGPRNVDLDILLIDNLVLRDNRLEVPHPGCAYRRFVLDPLVDIAPTWRHPVAGMTVAEIRGSLLQRPLAVAVETTDSQLASIRDLLRDFTTGGSLHIATSPPSLTLKCAETGRLSLSLPSQVIIHPADEAELRAVFTALLDEPETVGMIPDVDITY